MEHAATYLDKLFSKIKPYLRGNGGPIIMVQVIFSIKSAL